jgi:dolichyl-phosphate beta-glucosyltransferase
MSELPYLSIVVPAYNEAGRLPPTLSKLGEFFRGFTHSYEVLIVVEQSCDGTLEIASGIASQQAHFQVIDNRVQRGKGYAVRSGMNRARGEFVFYMVRISVCRSPRWPPSCVIGNKIRGSMSSSAIAGTP